MSFLVFIYSIFVWFVLLLYNSYFLKTLYMFILQPVLKCFNILMPDISYGVCVAIWLFIMAIVDTFRNKKNDKLYNVNDYSDVKEFLTKSSSVFLTRLFKISFYIIIMLITTVIVF